MKFKPTEDILSMFFEEYGLGQCVPNDATGNPIEQHLTELQFTYNGKLGFTSSATQSDAVECDAIKRIVINANGIGEQYNESDSDTNEEPAVIDQIRSELEHRPDLQLNGIEGHKDFEALNGLLLIP